MDQFHSLIIGRPISSRRFLILRLRVVSCWFMISLWNLSQLKEVNNQLKEVNNLHKKRNDQFKMLSR